MAQLNPNFEIDFNDINSYEQIQLINDTQLAKENLLMHKAYKEPAEDEIIRNQFSSFTFVDFCPKLFTINSGASRASSRPASSARMDHAGEPQNDGTNFEPRPALGSKMLRYQNYELETFSDLFDRINAWLKLNKDWRVVSMETLLFDCTSQFNHLKSSIHSTYLPRNMRGLRLYLSPSKSRFSGPQKIGCINVVPRKLSGHYDDPTRPLQYETLEQILARLNELLLTRPIEGRILSVETLTLPIANGYVNTETNYFMDSRLNLLHQRIYSHANNFQSAPAQEAVRLNAAGSQASAHAAHGLVDVLRVYYEFGPIVCGLVNLIDFLPHFHRQTRHMTSAAAPVRCEQQQQQQQQSCDSPEPPADQLKEQQLLEIDANETLTRLIRRSLAWFEGERKRILQETVALEAAGSAEQQLPESQSQGEKCQINLKLCNLQIHRKVLLKSQLAALTPQNVFETIQTGRMFHEAPSEPIGCARCSLSSQTHLLRDWCQHLLDLNEPFELKFVRLAYVVPVDNKLLAGRIATLSKPQASLGNSSLLLEEAHDELDPPESLQMSDDDDDDDDEQVEQLERKHSHVLDYSSPESISRAEAPDQQLDEDDEEEMEAETPTSSSSSSSSGDEVDELADDLHVLEGILEASGELDLESLAKEVSLGLVHETSRRQLANERAHQLGAESLDEQQQQQELASSMIGQLTYRLFAPCQLVSSSSCFSINPVNSSSPLSRRGSVNLNGGGGSSSMHGATISLSSENATPSTLLLPPGSSNALASVSESTVSLNQTVPLTTPPIHSQQQVISFGAFFPALSHEILVTSAAQLSPFGFGVGGGGGSAGTGTGNNNNTAKASTAHFTTNEFESVEAIRRRMEIYVTTNSMKVLAGETLIVNLSDQLSCLSSAIEQTIVRAAFLSQRPASSWVSVYVLYAAVDEPHLPGQLLEQQRLREQLALISEEEEEPPAQRASVAQAAGAAAKQPEVISNGECGQDNMVPVFDDDFKPAEPSAAAAAAAKSQASRKSLTLRIEPKQQQVAERNVSNATLASSSKTLASNLADGSIRVDLEHVSGGVSSAGGGLLYNSAYDRTVALPTQPDNHLSDYLEPVDFNLNPAQLADSLWFEEALGESSGRADLCGGAGSRQHEPITLTSVSVQAARRQMRLRQGRSAMVGGGGASAARQQKKLLSASGKRNKSTAKSSTRARQQQTQCSLI